MMYNVGVNRPLSDFSEYQLGGLLALNLLEYLKVMLERKLSELSEYQFLWGVELQFLPQKSDCIPASCDQEMHSMKMPELTIDLQFKFSKYFAAI